MKMNHCIDIFDFSKVDDKKGGFFLEWKKRMTLYAEIKKSKEGFVAIVWNDPNITTGQKVQWHTNDNQYDFYIHAIETLPIDHFVRLFLINNRQ
jgi:hypothetical protein